MSRKYDLEEGTYTRPDTASRAHRKGRLTSDRNERLTIEAVWIGMGCDCRVEAGLSAKTGTDQ